MDNLPKFPDRDERGHKGTFGTMVVVGGQSNQHIVMFGGVAMAAQAALKSGVGLIRFLMHKQELHSSIGIVPQATGLVLPANPDMIPRILETTSSVVIGIGFGVENYQERCLEKTLNLQIPTVIDADALTVLAEKPHLAKLVHEKCIVTPHPKEYERLALTFGIQPIHVHSGNNIPAAKQLAEKLGCVVILKGAETVVASESKTWEHDYPNPVLATGGSGDVLSGIAGSLLAQFATNSQLSTFECAQLAVSVHARAAHIWAKENGPRGMSLQELIDLIPESISQS